MFLRITLGNHFIIALLQSSTMNIKKKNVQKIVPTQKTPLTVIIILISKRKLLGTLEQTEQLKHEQRSCIKQTAVDFPVSEIQYS